MRICKESMWIYLHLDSGVAFHVADNEDGSALLERHLVGLECLNGTVLDNLGRRCRS